MHKIIAGNWKQKGTEELASDYLKYLTKNKVENCEIIVCPTFDLFSLTKPLQKFSGVSIGAQDFYHKDSDFNDRLGKVEDFAQFNITHVILGHSDRRNKCSESSQLVYEKVSVAWENNLVPIVCVGEKREERDAGRTLEVIQTQIHESINLGVLNKPLIIAYEPVWAIATGLTPTPDQIQSVHDYIRELMTNTFEASNDKVPILYGGSADSQNASTILEAPNVNGLLIGGASLNIQTFGKMIKAGTDSLTL